MNNSLVYTPDNSTGGQEAANQTQSFLGNQTSFESFDAAVDYTSEAGSVVVDYTASGDILGAMQAWVQFVGVMVSNVLGTPGESVTYLGFVFGMFLPGTLLALLVAVEGDDMHKLIGQVIQYFILISFPVIAVTYIASTLV